MSDTVYLPISELGEDNFINAPSWNIIKVGHGSDSSFHEVINNPFPSDENENKDKNENSNKKAGSGEHKRRNENENDNDIGDNDNGKVLKVKFSAGSYCPSASEGIPGGFGFYSSPQQIFPCKSVSNSNINNNRNSINGNDDTNNDNNTNDDNYPNKIDFNVAGNTDDLVLMSTIRSLAVMQIDATAMMETNKIKKEISETVKSMYETEKKIKNNFSSEKNERIPSRVPSSTSPHRNVLSYRDSKNRTPDKNIEKNVLSRERMPRTFSSSDSPEKNIPQMYTSQKNILPYNPTISDSLHFTHPSTSSSSSATFFSNLKNENRGRNHSEYFESPEKNIHKTVRKTVRSIVLM